MESDPDDQELVKLEETLKRRKEGEREVELQQVKVHDRRESPNLRESTQPARHKTRIITEEDIDEAFQPQGLRAAINAEPVFKSRTSNSTASASALNACEHSPNVRDSEHVVSYTPNLDGPGSNRYLLRRRAGFGSPEGRTPNPQLDRLSGGSQAAHKQAIIKSSKESHSSLRTSTRSTQSAKVRTNNTDGNTDVNTDADTDANADEDTASDTGTDQAIVEPPPSRAEIRPSRRSSHDSKPTMRAIITTAIDSALDLARQWISRIVIILSKISKHVYEKCCEVLQMVSAIVWHFLCVYSFAIPNMKNESTFGGAVNNTHVKIATAMHECNPLITLPYRLLHTDEALRDARWLIESSDVPSRTLLIQVILQYLNVSEPLRDDLSMFTANVGKTIDFVLLVTDTTVRNLTRISQQTRLPEGPGVTVSTFTTKNFIPYGHARVLLDHATAIVLPDFFFQPLKEFYRSFSKASASTTMNLVISAFTVYIDEISPKITVLISQADELLANLKHLQADLDNIRQLTGDDKRPLSESRAVIEDQRRYWKRFWVMIRGDADDMGPIERQADTLSRIDKVVIDGVQSLNGALWALKGVEADLQGLKEDIRIYKNHYRLAKGSEMSRSYHIQTVKLSAEKLRLAKEDWAHLRREVTN